MKPTDYLIRFKTGNLIRVPEGVGQAFELDKVFVVGNRKYFFASSDLQYVVPVVGEEGVIEPKSPKQVKADKEKKENAEVDKLYGLTAEQRAIS